ncbi:MAG: hypothetical protein PVG53_10230 [Holophagae bacterium]|jgi:hypothetical protein
MTEPDARSEPRVEDFGITEQDLSSVPRPWLMRYRPQVVFALFVATTTATFVGLLAAGAPTTAAALFSVVLVAAWSIVLIPIFVCLLCASERVERRWLCRRFPLLDACLAYREAVEEHRDRRVRREQNHADPGWWPTLTPEAFRLQIERQLEARGIPSRRVRDPHAAGYDSEISVGGERVLLRCVPGDHPVEIAVGRELIACLEETGADRAVIVTAAGADSDLEAYLVGRRLSVTDPVRLSI